MKISIQSLLEGARKASGAVAVIDTFRAFTTAAVALANGAPQIPFRNGQKGKRMKIGRKDPPQPKDDFVLKFVKP